MSFIQASLTFHPQQRAPFRKNGFGVWRVKSCGEVSIPLVMHVDGAALHMMVVKPLRVGSIVNPVKEAIKYIEHCRDLAAKTSTDLIYFGSAAHG